MAMVLGALMIVFAWMVWTQPEPVVKVPKHSESSRQAQAVPVPSVPAVP